MGLYPKTGRFERRLDVILEENDIFSAALGKLSEVDNAQQGLAGLQAELRENVEQIHGMLATEIRRASQNLDVWLDRSGNVRVKYGNRARSLRIKADARSRSWVVGDSPFERQFAKYNQDALTGDPATLAKAIAHFFKSNYKAMRGATNGAR